MIPFSIRTLYWLNRKIKIPANAAVNPNTSCRLKDSFRKTREYTKIIKIFIADIADTNPVVPTAKAEMIAIMPATFVKPTTSPQPKVLLFDQRPE